MTELYIGMGLWAAVFAVTTGLVAVHHREPRKRKGKHR